MLRSLAVLAAAGAGAAPVVASPGADGGGPPTPSLHKRDFPRRDGPLTFETREQQPFECVGVSHLVRFRDRGRFFQAHVALGMDASGEIGLDVLDSMRVR